MFFVRNWLAIGRYAETIDLSLLNQTGIQAMLQLAAPAGQSGILSLYLPVDDGQPLTPDLLEQGVRFIIDRHQDGYRVLVACGAGISRSTTFTMAALMRIEGLDLFETYRQILMVHPRALPHPELCLSLAKVHGLTLTRQEMMDRLWAAYLEVDPDRRRE